MGVDLGSTTAKTVILDSGGEIVAAEVIQMGAVSRAGLTRSVTAALRAADLDESDITATIATGYGRRLVPGVGRTFTEITCHARGVAAMCPGVRLVVDIGGQDSKAIQVDEWGLVDNFTMNDRCASGTGRFFEVLARAIECEVDELAGLSLTGDEDLEVSSMCATFAETEIVSLLAQDARREDIAASVHKAVSARTVGLVAKVGKRLPIVMTGGVARNAAAVHFLSVALDAPITVPARPQITGAYGAALLAREGSPQPDVAIPTMIPIHPVSP
ncbi:MAG TPA: acyl-CoA dehydratase activase, partial [Pseudonocardiaceae bacterium]|nr:acyl-CoA dehydratase activase [Pseudonocardiaceae bacterium]